MVHTSPWLPSRSAVGIHWTAFVGTGAAAPPAGTGAATASIVGTDEPVPIAMGTGA
jgi:hypothetical protein